MHVTVLTLLQKQLNIVTEEGHAVKMNGLAWYS